MHTRYMNVTFHAFYVSCMWRTMNENLPVPAIVIEEPPEQIEDVAWTYRFLIPTTVAIATLVILGNVIQYFRQVTRKRYKVIEK